MGNYISENLIIALLVHTIDVLLVRCSHSGLNECLSVSVSRVWLIGLVFGE